MVISKCKICGSVGHELLFEDCHDYEYSVQGKFKIIKCKSCGLISLYPIPSLQELIEYYPDSYHSYNTPVSSITKKLNYLTLRKRAENYKKLIGSRGNILDVGCADGHHFDILNKFGNWKFTGIEFNDKVAEIGRKAGREIYTDTLENHNFDGRTFDLIIMNHLLEHVIDPVETLNAANRLLNPSGYLVGEIPNIKSLDYFVFRKYWGGLHIPRHIYFFNPITLSKLMERCSFNIRNINFELDTGHWALSVQNFLQSKNISKTILRYGRAKYYPVLLGLFIPVNLIQKTFSCTGSIGFTANKNQSMESKKIKND